MLNEIGTFDIPETAGYMYSLVLVYNPHFKDHPRKGSLESIEDCSIEAKYLVGQLLPVHVGDIFEDSDVIYTVVEPPGRHFDLRNDRYILYVPVDEIK